MECNVGKIDKVIRVVVAILIAAVAYQYKIWWLYIFAIGPLVSAACGYCPPYKWLGINTCDK